VQIGYKALGVVVPKFWRRQRSDLEGSRKIVLCVRETGDLRCKIYRAQVGGNRL
jgi:hypothetical protein